jgi:hypothetical protein
VQLQGYFHPRHTAQDVHDWVSQSLSAPAQQIAFELYTTPPRTVLAPLPPAPTGKQAREKGVWGAGSQEAAAETAPTLHDLKLVPAAALFLAWKGPGAELLSGPETYLSADLLEAAMSRAEGVHASEPGTIAAYPVGHQLAPQQSSSSGDMLSASAKSGGAGRPAGKGEGHDEPRKMTKPKWFK